MERKKLSYKERWFLAYNQSFHDWLDNNEKNGDFIIPGCALENSWDERGIPKFEDEVADFKIKKIKDKIDEFKNKKVKNKIHIALDSYFFFEKENFKKIKNFLEENNIENEIYQIVPFSHEIIPPLPKDRMVVPFGCIEFVQEVRKMTDVSSTIFFDEEVFTNENCLNKWGSLCLNSDAQIMTVEEALSLEKDKQYFMRPIEDLKSFTGNLFTPGHLPSLLERYSGYENNQFNAKSRIVVSEPKNIKKEWRVFIVDGVVVASSLYKEDGKHKEALGAPSSVIKLCYNALDLYNPAKAFVLDICKLEDGEFYIVEFGCIHNCGFYSANVERIMDRIVKLFEDSIV